jgi:amino acid transporter
MPTEPTEFTEPSTAPDESATPSQFYRMPRGDLWVILTLLLAAALVFLFAWDGAPIAGIAPIGWLLAALMIFSPALALLRLVRARGDA